MEIKSTLNMIGSKYSTSIVGNKSYFPLFTPLIGMANLNTWLIHKFVKTDRKDILNLVDFKRDICLAWIKRCNNRTWVGWSRNSPWPSMVQDVIRYVMRGHLIVKRRDNTGVVRTSHVVHNWQLIYSKEKKGSLYGVFSYIPWKIFATLVISITHLHVIY